MKTMVKRFVGLAVLLCALLVCCACINPPQPGDPAAPPPNPTAEVMLGFLEGFASSGLIETVGTEALRKQKGGEQIIVLLDKPGPNGEEPDGHLTFAELKAIVTASSPAELGGRVAYLTAMGWAMHEARKARR